MMPGLHPGVRERRVVDQSHILEAGEHLLRHVLGDLPLGQRVRQLFAGTGVPVSRRRQIARARSAGSWGDSSCPALDGSELSPGLSVRRLFA